VNGFARKALAEFLGTALLVATVVGSGIFVTGLTGDPALRLLTNALVTGAMLVALIVALGPVSAAFNPWVTLAERIFGAIRTGEAVGFAVAQTVGGIAGTVLANLMFSRPAIAISTHARTGSGRWLSEGLTTFGLLLVVFGVVRSGRRAHVGYAVGCYVTASYFFAATGFSNAAVTIARMFSDTFAGIAPRSVPGFLVAQLIGTVAAVAAVRALYPQARELAVELTR